MRTSANIDYSFRLQTSEVQAIFEEFSKPPSSNLFFRNRIGLSQNCKNYEFSKRNWHLNPLQFCDDTYKKQYYYPIILLCNNIKSMFEFTQSNLNDVIKAPSASLIISILSFDKEPKS